MNNYVRGKYDSDINKIAYNEYAQKINKNASTVEEAINNAKEILEIEEINGTEFSNEFWSTIFTQKEDKIHDKLGSVKLCINTNEPLYSELPISKTLEAFATNILDKDEGGLYDSENKKIKLYTSKEEFEKQLKEERKLYLLAMKNGADSVNLSDVNEEFIMLMIPKNYKKVKTYDLSNIDKIDKKYGEEYPVIHEYCISYNVLNNKRKELSLLLKNPQIENKKEIFKQIKIISKQLGKIKEDINICLLELIRPIVWKQPLKDEGCPDWNEFDELDNSQIKALLQLYKESEVYDFQDDLGCMFQDLENVLRKIKLTDKQREVLELWKSGMTIKNIAKELNKKPQAINQMLDTVVNKIVQVYEEQLEDWYYLNICKGEYKKCNKCGEIKLINKFNKNGKGGVRNMCKICQ